MDRQRRKQAEFLVHRFCDWAMIQGIIVLDGRMREQVEDIQRQFSTDLHKTIRVRSDWYYRSEE
ncbi:MAG: DUF4433 domain-containing protein [Chloroflexi bacterium]|nr:DUF4433 domain-containing protein [Chloroflexota bacterium]